MRNYSSLLYKALNQVLLCGCVIKLEPDTWERFSGLPNFPPSGKRVLQFIGLLKLKVVSQWQLKEYVSFTHARNWTRLKGRWFTSWRAVTLHFRGQGTDSVERRRSRILATWHVSISIKICSAVEPEVHCAVPDSWSGPLCPRIKPFPPNALMVLPASWWEDCRNPWDGTQRQPQLHGHWVSICSYKHACTLHYKSGRWQNFTSLL